MLQPAKNSIEEENKLEYYRTLTLKQLLTNPPGKNSAFLANRQATIKDLRQRFDALKALHKEFPLKIFYNAESSIYTFHIKVPTEQKDLKAPLYYDVVIEFIPPDENSRTASLLNHHIKIWSNSPAFTFTYLYTVNKFKLLPTWLESKSSLKGLKEPSKVKNAVEVLGFEKSINFAGNYILYKEYFRPSTISGLTKPFKLSVVLKDISHSGKKLDEYNKLKKASYKPKPRGSSNLPLKKKANKFSIIKTAMKKAMVKTIKPRRKVSVVATKKVIKKRRSSK
jgi:hypothetical protein